VPADDLLARVEEQRAQRAAAQMEQERLAQRRAAGFAPSWVEQLRENGWSGNGNGWHGRR
jgi:hypothetical protein